MLVLRNETCNIKPSCQEVTPWITTYMGKPECFRSVAWVCVTDAHEWIFVHPHDHFPLILISVIWIALFDFCECSVRLHICIYQKWKLCSERKKDYDGNHAHPRAVCGRSHSVLPKTKEMLFLNGNCAAINTFCQCDAAVCFPKRCLRYPSSCFLIRNWTTTSINSSVAVSECVVSTY